MKFYSSSCPILEGIRSHISRDLIVGYTPGHKAGRGIWADFRQAYCSEPLSFDLGFMGPLDDFHAPNGIIVAAEAEMANLYGARDSFLLTNGSSAGLMGLLLAATGPGDTIVVPRNVHRAVMHGMILSGAIPRFVDTGIDPETGLPLPMSADSLDAAMIGGATAVFPVSPTYHGYIADIAAIARRTALRGAWLFVDEAHGAHLPFIGLEAFSGLKTGAHAVVQSTHKTLQAFTPGAVLHASQDGPASELLRTALRLVQSSSANYALLASLDCSRAFMAAEGVDRLADTLRGLDALRQRLNASDLLRAPDPGRLAPQGVVAIDPTKLFINVTRTGLTGPEMAKWLYDAVGIAVELMTQRGVLMIMTAADTAADMERLGDRLFAALATLPHSSATQDTASLMPSIAGPCAASPREAYFAEKERVPLSQCLNRIAAEAIVPYPPGVPALWPGERISGDTGAFRAQIRETGASIQASDPTLETLLVLR